MLIFDLHTIGNKLLSIRKRMGMTQAEVAEAAGLSDRTYADIERGTVNMRTETILRICNVLHITPDEVLTEENTSLSAQQAELWEVSVNPIPVLCVSQRCATISVSQLRVSATA